ncbi:helix-turn-helix domain-containing protein [Streptomyces antarcticus]|uniref:helix-turn-helix domain-containing protein n=1 Tax=Streptomyces antarcticus TaxID=2996458 RepID=UPI00226DAB90|nr:MULTISPECIES: helix-turn-helix transcriptional regulator [unclassified Streptomyces]MCY0940658.1 helix-turn-helix transcriptional regulator [Streptomyces sp. H34-AA3]MCZ4082074.1 helix-turn-helix transcriptional regulator [Streptomyces sp. H34-S5]
MNRGQLGAALRALRQASGKEAKAVARSAVMSASKLSKIETAKVAPSVVDVERILTAIGVSDEVKDEYLEAVRAAATEATAWRLIRRMGVHKAQQQTRALEAQMTLLRLFQPALIPGLLQTPEYIRAILSRHDLGEDVLTRTISVRIERQQALYDSTKQLHFILTEPVLRWRIVSAARMAEQIDRVVSLSRLPNIDIRIVPLSGRQQDVANHAFVIRDDRTVTVETVHAEIVVTDPRDVSLYVHKFEGFASIALSGDAMRATLEGIRDELLREQETG